MKRIVTVYLGTCFICFLFSCTKGNTGQSPPGVPEALTEPDTGKSVNFLIKQGTHYCIPDPLTFTTANKLSFNAVFDSTCIYTTRETSNQNDINKLYGFSDCGEHHLDNSARVGWRWSKDSLRLFGFVHLEGKMLMEQITTAGIGSVISCSIECLPASYLFTINGKSLQMPRSCAANASRYKLNPYFGGDETAPHDINIRIMELP